MVTRRPSESFQSFKLRQKIAARDYKRVGKRGDSIWVSCVLLPGDEMVQNWLSKNQDASAEDLAAVKKAFPPNKLFKVRANGTYRIKDAGRVGEEHQYGRKRILPSNRVKAVAAREAK